MDRFIVACPNCDRFFQLPTSLMSRKAKCDSCSCVFAITEGAIVSEPIVPEPIVSERMEHAILQTVANSQGYANDLEFAHVQSQSLQGIVGDDKYVAQCTSCELPFRFPISRLGIAVPCPRCVFLNDLSISENSESFVEDVDGAILVEPRATQEMEVRSSQPDLKDFDQLDHKSTVKEIFDEEAIPDQGARNPEELIQSFANHESSKKPQPIQRKITIVREPVPWTKGSVFLFSSWLAISFSGVLIGWNLIMPADVRWPIIFIGVAVGLIVRLVTSSTDRLAMYYAGFATLLGCLNTDYWLAVRDAAILAESVASEIMFSYSLLKRGMFDGFMLFFAALAVVVSAGINYPTE